MICIPVVLCGTPNDHVRLLSPIRIFPLRKVHGQRTWRIRTPEYPSERKSRATSVCTHTCAAPRSHLIHRSLLLLLLRYCTSERTVGCEGGEEPAGWTLAGPRPAGRPGTRAQRRRPPQRRRRRLLRLLAPRRLRLHRGPRPPPPHHRRPLRPRQRRRRCS